MHLHVEGQVIRTTGEHPFNEYTKGWIDAANLQKGDKVATKDGRWVNVEEVYDTGVWETVYNLRVADFHTYFVGGKDWEFAVWAHNASYYNPALRVNPPEVVAGLRKAFNATEKIAFIKQWATTAQAKRLLDASELALAARKGVLPDTLIVHHLIPLYRGGTNAINNLRVLPGSFHHKFREALHNYPIGQHPYGL